ncbi:putative membrane protein [Mycobacterium ulcerans str. Harvey]|uniref:Membrane protein n=1 Tax=Mycobacterium ulcerans str. Harvey TaxID=1299332 RepID=A0ABN0RAR3_MYCUL|nr:putative membrane protein [Mycobacterium ulcerans str. Harvey]
MRDAIATSEIAHAWIVVTICALVVAVALRLNTRWVAHVVLLIPTVIAVIATAVTGNAGQGPTTTLRPARRSSSRWRLPR